MTLFYEVVVECWIAFEKLALWGSWLRKQQFNLAPVNLFTCDCFGEFAAWWVQSTENSSKCNLQLTPSKAPSTLCVYVCVCIYIQTYVFYIYKKTKRTQKTCQNMGMVFLRVYFEQLVKSFIAFIGFVF